MACASRWIRCSDRITEARAARDIAAFAPEMRVLGPKLGEKLIVRGGEVTAGRGDVDIEISGGADQRVFKPMSPAPLVDANLGGARPSELRARIVRWVNDELGPAVLRARGRDPMLAPLRLSFEVVLPNDQLVFKLDPNGAVREGFDPEYAVYNAVTGSMLVDVIEGRRAWYEPLLTGCLRSCLRGALVAPGSALPIRYGPMFVYEAIGYRKSTERAALFRARELVNKRSRAESA